MKSGSPVILVIALLALTLGIVTCTDKPVGPPTKCGDSKLSCGNNINCEMYEKMYGGTWRCVNGACAQECKSGGLAGLCSSGLEPFAAVYCDSVEGTDVKVFTTNRFNVGGFPLALGFGIEPCSKNGDCDKYGPGYMCNHFSPGVTNYPKQCARPAPPSCFPLIPAECVTKCPNWPSCPSVCPL